MTSDDPVVPNRSRHIGSWIAPLLLPLVVYGASQELATMALQGISAQLYGIDASDGVLNLRLDRSNDKSLGRNFASSFKCTSDALQCGALASRILFHFAVSGFWCCASLLVILFSGYIFLGYAKEISAVARDWFAICAIGVGLAGTAVVWRGDPLFFEMKVQVWFDLATADGRAGSPIDGIFEIVRRVILINNTLAVWAAIALVSAAIAVSSFGKSERLDASSFAARSWDMRLLLFATSFLLIVGVVGTRTLLMMPTAVLPTKVEGTPAATGEARTPGPVAAAAAAADAKKAKSEDSGPNPSKVYADLATGVLAVQGAMFAALIVSMFLMPLYRLMQRQPIVQSGSAGARDPVQFWSVVQAALAILGPIIAGSAISGLENVLKIPT